MPPHRLVEQLEAGPSEVLGAVHGGVGVAEQRLGMGELAVGQGHADAGGDRELAGAEHDRRRLERGRDAQGDGRGLVGVVDVAAHDHELVATEPGHHVAGSEHAGDAAGRLDEQLVAGVVAEAVVDDLEPVEVEEQQGDEELVGPGGGDGVLELVEQQRPVGQVGQRVVGRLVGELFGLRAWRSVTSRPTDETACSWPSSSSSPTMFCHTRRIRPSWVRMSSSPLQTAPRLRTGTTDVAQRSPGHRR